ncbi:HK97 gp10 family phage protein [Clostridium baratii]|uniref:HK97 gp10 family phage protein n=1 Tax=Clostridium baratii TaxID=1561 RepID=UPI0030CD4F6B
MGVDFEEFKNFANNFKKMTFKYDKFLFDFLTKIAIDALAKTKKRTPVDTGELRRNWDITRVMKKGNDLIVYLYNSKDYASYVEMGHTTRNRTGWVEGYYMATISIEEVERKIPKRFEKEFIKFMDSCEVL